MCRINPEGCIPHGEIVAVVLFNVERLHKFQGYTSIPGTATGYLSSLIENNEGVWRFLRQGNLRNCCQL